MPDSNCLRRGNGTGGDHSYTIAPWPPEEAPPNTMPTKTGSMDEGENEREQERQEEKKAGSKQRHPPPSSAASFTLGAFLPSANGGHGRP
jgi:hypothetical protein